MAYRKWGAHIPVLGAALGQLQAASAYRIVSSLLLAGETMPTIARTVIASCSNAATREQIAHTCLFASRGAVDEDELRLLEIHPVLRQVILQGSGREAFSASLIEVAQQLDDSAAARIDTLITVAAGYIPAVQGSGPPCT